MTSPHLSRGRSAARLAGVAAVLLAVLASIVGPAAPAAALSANPSVVISQVYGGGGNTGAPYNADFVELFNRSAAPVSLAGMSIQYASATGTGNFGASTTQLTELPNVTMQPGQYFLVQQGSGTTGAALPTPDLVDATPIAMSATAGKVALATGTTSLGCNGGSTPCSPEQIARIVDLVGFGAANYFEGAGATPAPSNTTAVIRAAGGCTDTNSNSDDFTAGAPAPRNTASTQAPCGPRAPTLSISDVSAAEGNSGSTTFGFTVSLSSPAGAGGVTFDIGTANNTALTADNDYVAQSLTGQTIPQGSSSYSFEVIVNGDTNVEPTETFFVNITNLVGATVGDGQGQGTIVNDDFSPVACSASDTPIGQLQGSGAGTPFSGQTFTVQGVIVGDYEGSAAFRGFFLQNTPENDDDNAATSDGIFVFVDDNSTARQVGQVVQVTGPVSEFNNQTQISVSTPATQIELCGEGSITPTEISLPLSDAERERYESMLVKLPQALTISEYFNYDRFGEIVLSLPLDGRERPFTPTSYVEPGAAAQAVAAQIALHRITLDDGLNSQNPSTLRHPNGQPFSLTNRFRGGDTVANTVGVLDYRFSLFRIQPTAAADYTALNPRPASPEPVGGSLRAASFNVLNYFLTLDNGGNICGPARNQECRGADDATEFQRQEDKLVAALLGIDADVVGLIEMENTPDVEPAARLVSRLNAAQSDDTYAFIDTGVIGSDAIRVGFIYKSNTVTPLGDFAILDSSVDPDFIDTKNRPALAQSFEEQGTGASFTAVVNHFKSKGSDCNDVGDPDLGDGAGNCNLTREKAAQALADWLATDPTTSGDPDVLILGDLNSYDEEDPIDALKTAGYVDLNEAFGGEFAYSYVFDGQFGYLDYALANSSLVSQVTGATEWHINADEPDILNYDTSFKPAAQDALYEPNAFQSSDHDPVIVGLSLVNAPPATVADSYTMDERRALTVDAGAGVLANDSDPEGQPLTAALVSGPANGAVTLNPDGSFTYQRNLDFFGTDSFTYRAADGRVESAETTVTIEVVPAGLYRARQVGPRVWIERNVAAMGDFDGDPLDGWALVGRTNGAADNGELRGFFVEDGLPYVVVFNRSNNKGDRCILLTPRTLALVKKGQTRLMLNVDDNFTPCPATSSEQLPPQNP